jgi:hypothetical protein
MHPIWLQQLGTKEFWLYATPFNDYVWIFKQSTLYYKKGGPSRQGFNRNELLLCKTSQYGDYRCNFEDVIGLSFTTKITHLEGEETFGSYKQKPNLFPRSDGDSHWHDRVNCFHLVLTPKLENHICILSSLIGMNMWISPMKVLKS